MPWHVKKKGSQYCVHEGHAGSGGAEVTCHPTEAKAKAHLRALYANEPDAAAWLAEMDYLTAAFEDAHEFGSRVVEIEDSTGVRRNLNVQVAETAETRARGMIGRTFDGFEGLLFAYDEPVQHAFHMRGVPVQVYIAWFDAEGACIDHVSMHTEDPWHYTPPSAYRWALELPVTDNADFSWLTGSRLVFSAT